MFYTQINIIINKENKFQTYFIYVTTKSYITCFSSISHKSDIDINLCFYVGLKFNRILTYILNNVILILKYVYGICINIVYDCNSQYFL